MRKLMVKFDQKLSSCTKIGILHFPNRYNAITNSSYVYLFIINTKDYQVNANSEKERSVLLIWKGN